MTAEMAPGFQRFVLVVARWKSLLLQLLQVNTSAAKGGL